MPRAVPLTPSATWWPSTLYQTTTLELRRGDDRLLVDPGISPWEIDEVVSSTQAPVTQVLVGSKDWLSGEGIRNINAVNAALAPAKPWQAKLGLSAVPA